MPILFQKIPANLRVAIPATFITIVGAYLTAIVINSRTVERMGWEDGLIENAGALSFLVAAIVFLAVSVLLIQREPLSPVPNLRRSVVFALLAALMFVCFGEEISWGQRIFGWRTPETISRLNAQDETNIHNLQIVHQWKRDGTEKGFVAKLVNMNRLFSVFWLTVFVFVPLAANFSTRVRKLLKGAGVLVPSLWFGALFLASYAVYKVLAFIYADSIRAHALDEIKESSYALIYAVVALVALDWAIRRCLRGSESQHPDSTAA